VPQRPVVVGSVGEPEADVVELEPSAPWSVLRRTVGDISWGIEDLGDPVRGGE
jgi:hypothetical protein